MKLVKFDLRCPECEGKLLVEDDLGGQECLPVYSMGVKVPGIYRMDAYCPSCLPSWVLPEEQRDKFRELCAQS